MLHLAHTTRSIRRSAGTLALAATALALPLAGASPASAKDPVCKKPANIVAKKSGSYLFRKGSSLWACTAFYVDPPKTYRLGPWSQGHSRVSFDGSTAVWTVAGQKIEGVANDLVWAADAPAGKAWIKGVRPTLQGTAIDDTDNTVATLKAYGQSVAWVTNGGAVLMGTEEPDSDPVAIGTGTAAAAPAPVLGITQGLISPLKAKGHRLYVGRWNNLAPKDLGKTLKLAAGEGDGDECGGAGPWNLTVKPLADAPVVGATWDSYWTSTSNACRGL